ncbi:MAG: binding domain protein [Rhizobium sp.]|nr:binding domain protein [Rhizobium sp.]
MNAPLRHFVSPYARRLAREHGIALTDLQGSGPSGRIVAADILSFQQRAVAVEDQTPSPTPAAMPAIIVSAFAAQIDLGKLQDLLAQFAAAQLAVSIDTLIVRAAGRSLSQFGMNGEIGWEVGSGSDRREIHIANAGDAPLSVIQSHIAGFDVATPDADGPAYLSICSVRQSGIRAVSMPLLPGHKMRLIVSGSSIDIADCLFCFDAGRVSEDDAAAFLAQLRDDLETPLRLLA